MLEHFTWLTGLLSESQSMILIGGFIWGLISIVLSPCHLSAIPLIVGYINNREIPSIGRAAALSALFASGILITITVIGVITGVMGRLLGDIGLIGNLIVSIILIAIGLNLAGILPIPFLERGISQPEYQGKGLTSAFILGLVFGIALGPCTFAFMAPVLGVAITLSSKSPITSIGLVTAYGIGHTIVIVAAGTFSGMIQRYLYWNSKIRAADIAKKICGVLVVIAGVYMLYLTIKQNY
jgi:cytochrome c-type biogenesis protein